MPDAVDTDQVDIVLIDDHPLLAEGMAVRLAARSVSLIVANELTEVAIMSLMADARPRLALLDHLVPPMGVTTSLIEPIIELGIPVVILTGTRDDALWGRLLGLGACAVLGKDEPMDGIIEALIDVLDGRAIRTSQALSYRRAWLDHQAAQRERWQPFEALSAREGTILWALFEGRNPVEIAEAEFVSVSTVRSQIKSAFRKLGVNSQLEAITMIRNRGWSPTSSSSLE